MELCYDYNIRQFSSQPISVFLASSQASKSSCHCKTNVMQGNRRELEEGGEGKEGNYEDEEEGEEEGEDEDEDEEGK